MIGEHERYAPADRVDGYVMKMRHDTEEQAQAICDALQKALGGQWYVLDTKPDEDDHALVMA